MLHIGPIDLEIDAGECVTISAPSGAGKSLLLRAIADLLPHEGKIYLGEQECASLKAHLWRKQVGYLSAESQWWYDTIGEHFAECATVDFTRVGFEQDICHWEIRRCSTGEKQRLALLRMLQNQPDCLLLDEPTASLDKENMTRVEGLVRDYRIAHDASVIWVSHDPDQADRVADRHFKLRDGQLQALV